MRIQKYFSLYCLLLIAVSEANSQDIIFLHHSTGSLIYYYGNVAPWIDSYNQANGTSIQVIERSYPDTPWPWSNYPYDYWKLWIGGSCNSVDTNIECLNTLAANYDMVIFKHCFPGANIGPDTGTPDVNSSIKTLENYKAQYRAFRSLFDTYPDTEFMVWTLAPLHRLATTTENAQRANEFVQWVKNEWLTEDGNPHPNIVIFDFFNLVAEQSQNPENGTQYCLKYDFEKSHLDSDSHPNIAASQYVGPFFAQAIVDAIVSNQVPVTSITLTGSGGATSITTDNGTLQLSATVSPSNATNKTVTWSVQNGTGEATINSTGLVTAISNGTVTARATANDGSGVYGELIFTISNQAIPVTSITVTGEGGATTITTDNGTLQLSAAVSPSNASNNTVTWTIENGTGQATINSTGFVTSVADGTVTARATANDGSGVYGELVITIASQFIPVTNITVTGEGGVTTITTDNGTLQLSAAVSPSNANNNTVTWTIENGTGQATINSTGLVTAIADGMVTARATANDDSGVYGELVITIASQVIPVTNITVSGSGGATTITTDNGTLQLSAAVSPSNASNKTVTWTIENSTGQATINSTGLVTSIADGTITARATANDGSGVYGELLILLSNQFVSVREIELKSTNGTSINTPRGTLQLSAEILPAYATIKGITWSISGGTGQISLSPTGLVTAYADGVVNIKAASKENINISDTINIQITNQSTDLLEFDNITYYSINYHSSILGIHFSVLDRNLQYISLYNVLGVLLAKHKININKLEYYFENISPGIFIIEIIGNNERSTVKIFVY